MGQGVILVTDPHAEKKIDDSLPSAIQPFSIGLRNTETNNLIESELEARCSKTVDILTAAYWNMVGHLCRWVSLGTLP